MNSRLKIEPFARVLPTLHESIPTALNSGQQMLLAKQRTAHCANASRPLRMHGRQSFAPFRPMAPPRACQPCYLLHLAHSNQMLRLRRHHHHRQHHPKTRRHHSPYLYRLALSFHLMTLFFLYPRRRPMPAFRLEPQARVSSISLMSPLATQHGW